MPAPSPDELKWYWGIAVGVGGFIAGIFTAGMATQRVLDKYVTKDFLKEKCSDCDDNLKRRKNDRDMQQSKDSADLTRELQNIHSAISSQGEKIGYIGEAVAKIEGQLMAAKKLS